MVEQASEPWTVSLEDRIGDIRAGVHVGESMVKTQGGSNGKFPDAGVANRL